MALWRLYYHIVWAVKSRFSLITDDIEKPLYQYLIGKADSLGGVVHTIGGIEDHIHLAVSIPPKIAVSDFVGKMKGSSSHHVSNEIQKAFAWQRGYGVFSFGLKQLETAVNYIRNQKKHHREGSIIRALEKFDDESD